MWGVRWWRNERGQRTSEWLKIKGGERGGEEGVKRWERRDREGERRERKQPKQKGRERREMEKEEKITKITTNTNRLRNRQAGGQTDRLTGEEIQSNQSHSLLIEWDKKKPLKPKRRPCKTCVASLKCTLGPLFFFLPSLLLPLFLPSIHSFVPWSPSVSPYRPLKINNCLFPFILHSQNPTSLVESTRIFRSVNNDKPLL